MREMIFLALSLFFAGCGLPTVTIFQLDTKHQVANPNKIVKYDTEKCVAVIEELPEVKIDTLHGFFCLSPEDAGKWKAHMQSECRIKNESKTNANSP